MTSEQRDDATGPDGAVVVHEIVAFSVMVDSEAQLLNLKLALHDGSTQALVLAQPVVAHIREALMGTLRSRSGATELPKDARFFERLPAISAADWDLGRSGVAAPAGCEMVTHPNLCRLSFPVDMGRVRLRYVLRPLYAGYLLHAINDAMENEGLGAAPREAALLH